MESRRSGRDDVEIYESFEAADCVASKIQQETDVGFAEICLFGLQDIHQAKRSNPRLHGGPCCIAKAISELCHSEFFNVNHEPGSSDPPCREE